MASGVAGIALGQDRPVARPTGLHHVRMDGNNHKAGLDQMIDQEAGRPLDGNRDLAGQFVPL